MITSAAISREAPKDGSPQTPSPLFRADFEQADWYRAWGLDEPPRNTRVVDQDPDIGFKPHDGKALRIKVNKDGHYGVSFAYRFEEQTGEEPEAISFRFYLRFGNTWDPERGGKLPGISGTYGRAGWGGRPSHGDDGWSARGLFQGVENGHTPVGFYSYHADMKGRYGSHWVWDRKNRGFLENNQWYCIEQYVALNTPGKRNGVLRGWVDGKLAFEKQDIRFRSTDILKIEQVWMNLYHGGRWTAKSDQHLYIDDVVISKARIGCNRKTAEPPIQPYEPNPGYWQYNGKPAMLIGANKWDAPFFLKDPDAFYEELAEAGGNYTRYILKQRLDESGERVQLTPMFPFRQLKNGLYDLSQWNPRYWKRFANGIKRCEELGIVTQVTLWDRFDFYRRQWRESPWNPENNINYTAEESGLASDYPVHPGGDTNPFMKTVPTMEANDVVLEYQKRLISKLMSITLEHGNVLYNMGNEGNLGQLKWDRWWNQFIHEKAEEENRTIYTTSMYGKQRWQPVVENPEPYAYVEGSKVGSTWTATGQAQYETALGLLRSVRQTKRRPVNAVKIRTQKIVKHAQARLWRPLMAGFAAVSHHRTTAEPAHAGGPGSFDGNHRDDYLKGGLGFEPPARRNIRAMRLFTDAVVPWETEPHPELLAERADDEAYLRAQPGEVYGIYFPDSGNVGLDLTNVEGRFRVRWIDIAKGGYINEQRSINGGRTVAIETPKPSTAGWAAVITKGGPSD